MALRKVTNNTIASNTVMGTNMQIAQVEQYHLSTGLQSTITSANNNAWVNSNDFATFTTLNTELDSLSSNLNSLSINNGNFLWNNTNVATGTSNVFFIGKEIDSIQQINLYKDGLLQTSSDYIFNSGNNTVQFKASSVAANSVIVIDSFYFGPDSVIVYEKDNLLTLSKLGFINRYPTVQEPTTSMNPKRINKTEKLFAAVQSESTFTVNNKRELELVNPNTVRIIHNPNTGERLGIYKEAYRQNHFKQVLDIEGGSNWVLSGSDITATNNVAQAPDLSSTATGLISLNTNSVSHTVTYSASELPDANFKNYVFDVYCKSELYNNFGIQIKTNSADYITATANIANGVITSNVAGNWKIERYSNNWSRLIGSNFNSSGAAFDSLEFGFMPDSVTIGTTYLGNDSNYAGYVWAPKLEESNVAHMPILNDTTNNIVKADIVTTDIIVEDYADYENGLKVSITPLGSYVSDLDPIFLYSINDSNNKTTYNVNIIGDSNLDVVSNVATSIFSNGHLTTNILNTSNVSSDLDFDTKEHVGFLSGLTLKSFTSSTTQYQPYLSRNGKKLYILDAGFKKLYENIFETSYALDTFIASNTYIGELANQTTLGSVVLNNNEDKMFIQAYNAPNDNIMTYSLSIPGQINTASLISDVTIDANSKAYRYMCFSDTGHQLFVGRNAGEITQFNLSESYNVETSTLYEISKKLNTGSGEQTLSSVNINKEGTKLYLNSPHPGNVTLLTLQEPNDISSIDYDTYFNLTNETTTPKDGVFNNTGSKLFIISSSEDILSYDLTENYNIETMVSNSSFSSNIAAEGLIFDNVGNNLYVAEASVIKQFSLSESFNIQTSTYSNIFSTSADSASNRGIYFQDNGTNVYVSGTNSIVQYSLSTPYDIGTSTFSNKVESNPNPDLLNGVSNDLTSIVFNLDGTKAYITDAFQEALHTITLQEQWNIASYVPNTKFSTASEHSSPVAVEVSAPGHKMYVMNSSGASVFEYNLSSNYDSTSATYYQNVDLSSDSATMQRIRFSPDGDIMYTVSTSAVIYQYSLSDNWNVASATLSNSVAGPSAGSISGFSINSSGTEAHLFTNKIHRYTLSDPFNIESGIINSSNVFASLQDVQFSEDGLKFYTLNDTSTVREELIEYNLSESYNVDSILTSTVPQSFSLDNYDAFVKGLSIGSDGCNVYIAGYQNRGIYQIRLENPYDLSNVKNSTFTSTLYSVLNEPEGLFFGNNGNLVCIVSGSTNNVFSIPTRKPYSLDLEFKFDTLYPELVFSDTESFISKDTTKIYTAFRSYTNQINLAIPSKLTNHTEFDFSTLHLGESSNQHSTVILHEIDMYNKLLSNLELSTLSE